MRHWVAPILFLLSAVPAAGKDIDFAHEVVPVLREYCGKCHTGDQKKGGLSFNTRESSLVGGESGPALTANRSAASELVLRVLATDDSRMPPEGPRVPAAKIEILKRWIDEGATWEQGFSFGERPYEPQLKPRRPELPPVVDGRANPVDRIIDAYLAEKKRPRPQPINDATFARRAWLDLIGLLPTPENLQAFLDDPSPDKRTRLVRELLARDVDYAEHWLTFWNDLLRNDYTGTGFITGGRKQISKWLYLALVTNKPYDQFARELIAPTPENSGYIDGIRWRGDVSAGQTVEIQFAQSVGQSFLGINLKCASCHDSFIDRWTLEESFGLAAIYSTRPLEIHRCDKPVGKTAQAAWLFPELGQVNAAAPQPERLQQLAALMTHPENGRFQRTIVNRLWHRLMGRGIVHPVDAMQSPPWNADLLDELAAQLVDHGFDLKEVLALIATSQAYQSQTQVVAEGIDDHGYVYAGPRAKRLTAEQFMDTVWQLTGAAPTRYDAPVLRGKPDPAAENTALAGKWIWSRAEAGDAPAGETIAFRKKFDLPAAPTFGLAVATCDNSYTLFVNGQRAGAGENWEAPDAILLTPHLKAGPNEFLIVAKNGGASPNPAGLFCEARIRLADGTSATVATANDWEWTATQPERNGRYKSEPTDWQPAAPVAHPEVWANRLQETLAATLSQGSTSAGLMVRASLVKSDFLMRSLGRPNRDQIVSVRPEQLTTLEAMDLSNGQVLAEALHRGAGNILARNPTTPADCVRDLYRFALSRDPTPDESSALQAALGNPLTEAGLEDVLWAIVMLPEFQLVR